MDEILDDVLGQHNSEINYKVASKNKRFANYLIDLISYFFLAAFLGVLYALFTVDAGNEIFIEEPLSLTDRIYEWLLSAMIIITYYTLSEYLLKGKTIGKFITKTRAITIDNEQMSFETTLKRSFCRIIPFEAFSFLGDQSVGWHDSLSNTKVIEDEHWNENERY